MAYTGTQDSQGALHVILWLCCVFLQALFTFIWLPLLSGNVLRQQVLRGALASPTDAGLQAKPL